jgi:hypothetical protein
MEVSGCLHVSSSLPPGKILRYLFDMRLGIHNAKVKCLFAVNRSCIHGSVWVSPRGKNSEDSSLASVEAVQWDILYLPIGDDMETIWHSTVNTCRSTIML